MRVSLFVTRLADQSYAGGPAPKSADIGQGRPRARPARGFEKA
ncbi:MAG: hypothetical protein ACUVUP_01445 [Thermaceae bacterium]